MTRFKRHWSIIAFLPVGISHMEHPKILQGGASGALLCAYWPHATGRMQMRKFLLERVITCYNKQQKHRNETHSI
jgi:hypothetical protein